MKKTDTQGPLNHSRLDTKAVLRWSAAAATGLTLMGCPDDKSAPEGEKAGDQAAAPHAAAVEQADKDKACCIGKNECKGKGGCAVPEGNSCAGKNECKGKGGCNMHCPK